MDQRIFIAATEQRSGKTFITIGLINALRGLVPHVGYMKPIGQRYKPGEKIDSDAALIKGIFALDDDPVDINPVSMEEAIRNTDTVFETIFSAFGKIEKGRNAVIIEGTDYMSATAALEFDINAELAKNLNADVLLIASAAGKTFDELTGSIIECADSFREMGCNLLGTIINRTESAHIEEEGRRLKAFLEERQIPLFGIVPDNPKIAGPRLKEIIEKLGATLIDCASDLSEIVTDVRVLAMTPENALMHMKDKDGCLLITPGDRIDIIFTALAAQESRRFPHYSGIMLTGGLVPGENVRTLITGIPDTCLTMISVKEDTYSTALNVNNVKGELADDDWEKISMVNRLVENSVDIDRIHTMLGRVRTNIITPKMFQYRILQKAKEKQKHIVLPEGTEKRVIIAAAEVLERGTCRLTLIGNEEKIKETARNNRVDISGVKIVDNTLFDAKTIDRYASRLYKLRKHKGMTQEMARDLMLDPVYFAALMVKCGDADGYVSGAVHSTADTLRPALQIIKTKHGASLASSIFFMCMPDNVLVYGDCALVENPDADQLADIAVTSADTARSFGIEPVVAILSYSTGESGRGKDVDKVRKATEIARKKRPDLPIEGPIQYDAATSEEVARVKLKDSKVAGKATVYIFPDLDAGNTAYKAVQRSAKVPAIGPVIQGLNKPANDLSRGAEVIDIVYTIAVTAIQAQSIRPPAR